MVEVTLLIGYSCSVGYLVVSTVFMVTLAELTAEFGVVYHEDGKIKIWHC